MMWKQMSLMMIPTYSAERHAVQKVLPRHAIPSQGSLSCALPPSKPDRV